MIDEDVLQMSKDQLVGEIKKLRAGIREHRFSTGQANVGITPNYGLCFPKK